MPKAANSGLLGFAKSIYRDFRILLVSPVCLLCNMDLNETEIICSKCQAELLNANAGYGPVCPFCGGSAKAGERHNLNGCRDNLRMYYWGFYNDLLKVAILHFKFHAAVDLGQQISQMALENMKSTINKEGYDIIIPVPLHSGRKYMRQFNQSQVISEEIGKGLGIGVKSAILKKTKATRQQAKLVEDDRWKNVEGVFQVDDKSLNDVEGKSILLVDDIVTTGATIYNCIAPLRKAGAKTVDIFCLAYAKR